MNKAAPVIPPVASTNPVRDLQNSLEHAVKGLNQVIQDRMQSDVQLINQLGAYIIAAGGKRIRPLLTIAMAQLCGAQADDPRVLKLAAAVEFIHTATLLHDDVVDESEQRRGQPSANALFGNQASVLVGDFLFSRAFELMVETGHLEVLRILSNASAVIASGEVMQLMATGDITLDRTRYLEVIGAKTAALFAAACEAGGVIAGATPEQITACRTYGEELGIAFQIADDVMDYAVASSDMGKNPGDDFREGKITLPVVLALQQADAEEKAFWQRCMVDLQQSENDLIHAQTVLRQHDTLEQSLQIADDYAARAASRLATLPQQDLTAILRQIPAFAVHRSA
ncbi:MAG TPA: polyprenyl synthetase family protein [Alphaproteobacteria bacterium]